jgi:DNA-binding NarL/FixJ family response regulator
MTTAPPGRIRVLIADDQRVVRDGLSMLVSLIDGVEIVGLASDGTEAVRLAEEHRPDVILMDLRMPGLDGATATAQVRERLPGTRVLVLTTYADEAAILAALRAGALGYLTKDNAEIAQRLFLSNATVKTHINRIFAKTGARDRAQAVRFAYTHGLTTPAP